MSTSSALSDINASGSGDVDALGSSSNPYGVGVYSPGTTEAGTNGLTSGLDSSGLDLSDSAILGTSSSGALSTTGADSSDALSSIDSSGSSSSLLSGLGSVLGDIGSIATSPLGEAGILAGLGEYEASEAQSQTASLTSQLTTPAQPYVSGAESELSQTLSGLTGSGTAPPAGSSIAQQETAASELGSVADQYSTGQLTTAQQQQVQQYIQSQQQSIQQQLANQGITDGSVISMYDQEIQNNAAQLTQSLINQNLTMGQQALTSAQQTYSTLLNQSISQFTAGMGPIEDAVNTTIQQNTQIASMLNQLFGNIAKALGGSSSGSGSVNLNSTGSLISGLGNLGNDINNLLNGSSSSTLGTLTAAPSASVGAPAVDLATTDFSTASLFGGTLPETDVLAETGVTPAFDTGFIGSGADAAASAAQAADLGYGASDLGDLSSLSGDLSDLGFSSAGGEAAVTPALTDVTSGLDTAVSSDADAALADADSDLASTGASAASGALGTAAQALGALGAGASLYNEVESYQSGATGSDALSGAESGASIGTMILPGIGTAIGGLLGGAAGAIASAFGGGKTDPESETADALDQAGTGTTSALTDPQAFQYLAGVMDAKNDSPGHAQPIELVFGRMGEGNLLNQMAGQINAGVESGAITPGESASEVYSSVIAPWLTSEGAAINPQSVDVTGANEGENLIDAVTDLIGGYMSGAITPSTSLGVSGQADASLPEFVGFPS